ncbi:hypothetical protein BV25DRAFT_1822755 [Artomyces pyxidatus]|uniref:Uncharacterized protein n=1 Tax=Artomyces pyxidatus TaxID=48021 RepID=A0ACB8T9Z1_9AGAM|nr:hypothetical protein BV25DRAFT_1822755 [Artomyces pyxidatus]
MMHLIDGLTMYKMKTPPTMVLAVGCGFRSWAVKAAETWPDCKVTGHSLIPIPEIGRISRSSRIAGRIEVVSRKFSADGLDYPDNTFDIVRISYCSLTLAEQEWHFLVKDAHRILKPGGVLEIVEDDLIFPGVRENTPSPPSSPPPSLPPIPHEPELQFPNNSRTSLLKPKRTSTYSSDVKAAPYLPPPLPEKPPRHGSDSFLDDPSPFDSELSQDPFDHSKLSHAWQEMLSGLNIMSQASSVLPLYLEAVFGDYRAVPVLEISMPEMPTSSRRQSGRSDLMSVLNQKIDPAPYRRLGRARVKGDGDSASVLSGGSNASAHLISAWAPLHLGRMVEVVKSCKESVWEAYDRLYGEGPTITPVVGSDLDGRFEGSARDEFDIAWFNWEIEMMAHMDLRHVVANALNWPEPASEPPDLRLWRDSLWAASTPKSSSMSSPVSPGTPNVCRRVRGFVAWKAHSS